MSETPKFEVIDRRKYKADEEEAQQSAPTPPTSAAQTDTPPPPAEAPKSTGPRLVTPLSSEPVAETTPAEELDDEQLAGAPPLPPPPTPEESREQKSAYDASSQRLEDLVRAQNPAAGAQPPITFEHLVQQLYVSAMIQMGAASSEGQRPRVDILGARQTIDLLGILQEKTTGNLTPNEERILDTVLFEARMAFLELTNMIAMPGVQAPPPAPNR
ncbi:MAG TPA: DUF1844 domain-containing protein [Terracidiphilus sp.]